MGAATQSFQRRDGSLRLTFEFSGDEISLAERRVVAKVAPPSEDLERKRPRERSGFWMELQDGKGRTLYRRVIRNPIRANAEVALEEGGFTNRVSVAQRGTFSLVVPNLREAADLALFASPLDRPHLPEPASEVVRVPVRERKPREPDDERQTPDDEQTPGRDTGGDFTSE
ncbi:MAG: hypothetical protein M3425_04510 [Actinomycetota bacterium]|nr:hypothetical protein [Actinomycetota bacterium]MDQ3529198.1 hypothetical protein [Actinomycetota bacterium]